MITVITVIKLIYRQKSTIKKEKKKHVNIERNYFIVNVTNPKWKC